MSSSRDALDRVLQKALLELSVHLVGELENVRSASSGSGDPRFICGVMKRARVSAIVPLRGTDWHAVREEAGQLFLDLPVEAAQIARANLANFHGRVLSPAETQRIATVASRRTRAIASSPSPRPWT